ncbi:GmrSD restriction endonuclease domain-containing protein [Actinomycetospora sp. CA-101289]|uniref:GmrSD restriction endonuclease domain-containing protein n=1 Tax=Actinomycetospora sp. CA-101289 TaxID=3239893 RepID=UPI003D95971F
MPFESPDVELEDLLELAATGKLQLPDFQRGWKWDDDRIRALIASVAQGHPVGVAMTLEVGGGGSNFKPIPIAGVDPKSAAAPEQLLLDGQQRTTSLYQALYSGRVVDTKDARDRRIRRWYFIDIEKALAPNADLEDAVVSIPEDLVVRENFGKDVATDLGTTEKQCEAGAFPAWIVFDSDATTEWMWAYIEAEPTNKDRWKEFHKKVLKEITGYKVPVIRLTKDTSKEAVCTVFEKVNTGGVPLNAFELLTATFATEDFPLKDDWAHRQERLHRKPVLRSLESTDFLQAISLLATGARRDDGLIEPGSTSCKRRDILRLSLEDYRRWADPVTEALEWCHQFLAREHFFRAADLPYRTQLVPLAVIRVLLGKDADVFATRAMIRRWFWCGVLGEMYGGSTETRFARDVEQVPAWVRGGRREPGTVGEAAFYAARLLTLKTRNSAAYKGVYALLMKRGALDWIKDQPMGLATFFDFKIDIHHIFPKAWCDKNGVDGDHRESIVNKTAISFDTNRAIGGVAPSRYLDKVEKKSGLDGAALDRVLGTHLVDPAALRADDFDSFFRARRAALLDLIAEAMEKRAIDDAADDAAEAAMFEPQAEDPEDESGLVGEIPAA